MLFILFRTEFKDNICEGFYVVVFFLKCFYELNRKLEGQSKHNTFPIYHCFFVLSLPKLLQYSKIFVYVSIESSYLSAFLYSTVMIFLF